MPPQPGIDLSPSAWQQLNEDTVAIQRLVGDSPTRRVVEIGQRLHAIHQHVGRCGFHSWLQAHFKWGKATASNYMLVARVYGDLPPDCLNRFHPSALVILARDNVPRQARDEAIRLARGGETITKSRAGQLTAAYGVVGRRRRSSAVLKFRNSVRLLEAELDDGGLSADEIEDVLQTVAALHNRLTTGKGRRETE